MKANEGRTIPTLAYGVFYAVALSMLAATLLALSAFASTTLSQSYTTKDKLSIGSIVSLKDNSEDEVEAAKASNVDNTFGVVINEGTSLLNLSNGKSDSVQIATSGTVPVLVSDINGTIRRGDHITASPIAGVGMRASTNVRIVGIAQTDMKATKKASYKTKSGETKTTMLDEVSVLVNVAYYFKEPDKTIVPAGIQNVANALAGREVSSLPIVLSSGIFLIMIILVSSIAYSMIRSSIISVGRNPMSQSAIYRDLIQMSAIVLAILGVGLAAIYLILTRL